MANLEDGEKIAFVIESPISLTEAKLRYVAWEASHVDDGRTILAERLKLSRRTLYRKLSKLERAD